MLDARLSVLHHSNNENPDNQGNNYRQYNTPYDVGSSYKYAFKRGIEDHGLVIEWVNSLIEQVTQFVKFSFIYPFKIMSPTNQ